MACGCGEEPAVGEEAEGMTSFASFSIELVPFSLFRLVRHHRPAGKSTHCINIRYCRLMLNSCSNSARLVIDSDASLSRDKKKKKICEPDLYAAVKRAPRSHQPGKGQGHLNLAIPTPMVVARSGLKHVSSLSHFIYKGQTRVGFAGSFLQIYFPPAAGIPRHPAADSDNDTLYAEGPQVETSVGVLVHIAQIDLVQIAHR